LRDMRDYPACIMVKLRAGENPPRSNAGGQ
jgi:hypothetical protein